MLMIKPLNEQKNKGKKSRERYLSVCTWYYYINTVPWLHNACLWQGHMMSLELAAENLRAALHCAWVKMAEECACKSNTGRIAKASNDGRRAAPVQWLRPLLVEKHLNELSTLINFAVFFLVFFVFFFFLHRITETTRHYSYHGSSEFVMNLAMKIVGHSC